jgi:hypothetical protein
MRRELAILGGLGLWLVAAHALAQSSRYDKLANAPFERGFLEESAINELKDELVFQRAVQSYIWALRSTCRHEGRLEKALAPATTCCPSSSGSTLKRRRRTRT